MRHTSQRNAQILALYNEGVTLEAIGQQYGVTRERIRQIVLRAGATPRWEQARARSAERAGEARGLAANGLTKREIAAQMGLALHIVDKICADHEIQTERWTIAYRAAMACAVDRVRNGESIYSAAGRSHRFAERLRRECRKAGVGTRHSPYRDLSHRAQIITDMRAQGATWADIALKLSEIEGRSFHANSAHMWAVNHMPILPGRARIMRLRPARPPKPRPPLQDAANFQPAPTIAEACVINRGKLTARQIADKLGITRNSVIGHWFRARQAGLIS